MVGFEVTPVMPSSSTSERSLPSSSSSREMLSSQIDWPCASISRRWFVAIGIGLPWSLGGHARALQRQHLAEPPLVAIEPGEAGPQEHVDQVERERLAHDAGSQAHHVRVVVLARLVRREHVVAERGAHAADLVDSDRRAGARAAQQQPELGVAVHDRAAEVLGPVRVVVRLERVVDAEVDRLVAAQREVGEHGPPQLDAGVVRGDRDPHRAPAPAPARTSWRAAVTMWSASMPAAATSSSGLPEVGISCTASLITRGGDSLWQSASSTASPRPPSAQWSSTVM